MAALARVTNPPWKEQILTATPQVAENSARTPDRVAAALAGGFVILLVATELVVSLPDQTAGAADVATFYAAHRTLIIALQLLGSRPRCCWAATRGGCAGSIGPCRQRGW